MQTAGVDRSPLRDLIVGDRRMLGQTRPQRTSVPLHTVAYQKSVWVSLRRRLRSDRALRVRLVCCAASLLLLALGLLVRRGASAALPSKTARTETVVTTRPFPAASLAAANVETTRVDAPLADSPASRSKLSAIRRLQRADILLRSEGQKAASAARALLESALNELPGSVHGQVALAEACRRLGDETCARTAIHTAVLARPWRNKYRVLATEIDREFAPATRAEL